MMPSDIFLRPLKIHDTCTCIYICAVVETSNERTIQWNLSNLDTHETEESAMISEVSVFQGLNCTAFGTTESVLAIY